MNAVQVFSVLVFIFPGILFSNELPGLIFPPKPVPLFGETPCPTCHGSGRETVEDTGVQAQNIVRAKLVRTCRSCRARGRTVQRLTFAERLERQKTQRLRFDTEQLAAGNVPLAGGYIKPGTADLLSPEAFAKLAHQCPKPCKACWGLGMEMCRSCRGTGSTLERMRNKDGEQLIKKVPCQACSGTGTQSCRKCSGTGALPFCRKCSGTGITHARSRDGSPGASERCKNCRGEGRR